MTQPTPPAETPAAKPAPQAAPPAVPQPAPVTAPAEPGALTEAEQQELARLLAKKAASLSPDDTVRLRVEPPHESMTYGGHTVGNEFTPVPADMATPLTEAAQRAGVTLIQES